MEPMQQNEGDARRLVEAAAWRVRLAEAGKANGPDPNFDSWLHDDPRNEAAWRQVDGPWQLFGDQATAPELMSARRAALRRAQQAYARQRRGPVFARALAASVLAVAVGVFIFWHSSSPELYRTAPGERRALMLSDGSTIALDAESEVQVRYSESARKLKLVRGQAQFDVVHDMRRPFEVTAGGETVIATGTSFNVELFESRLLVTLIQGHVIVVPSTPESQGQGGAPDSASAAAGKSRLELKAGEQLVISPTAPPKIKEVDVDGATSWQSGRLVIEDETLASVAARMSRYTRRPIRVTDADTAKLKITGVFRSGDVDGFISTLTTYFPIAATTGQNGEIELHRQQ
jgi:transmembrane sensor